MFRFDIDLLLLIQRYSAFQIQKYLRFFGFIGPYLPNHQENLQNYYSPHLFHLNNQRNLIIQQNQRIISEFNQIQSNILEKQSQEKQKEEKVNQFTHQGQSSHSNLVKIQNILEEIDPQNIKTKKSKKKKKIKKINIKLKRQKQLKRNQSQNSKRNIIPNEIHQMLSILFKKKRSTTMVQNLLKKLSPSFSSSFTCHRFYQYQNLLKQKISHYINQEGLKILFTHFEPSYLIYSKEQQIIYNKIGLILIDQFLKSEASLIILNSQRIKRENKLNHLKAKRYLRCLLFDLFQQNRINNSPQTI